MKAFFLLNTFKCFQLNSLYTSCGFCFEGVSVQHHWQNFFSAGRCYQLSSPPIDTTIQTLIKVYITSLIHFTFDLDNKSFSSTLINTILASTPVQTIFSSIHVWHFVIIITTTVLALAGYCNAKRMNQQHALLF